ncbi:MAG: NERD domain-containing protein/DEAD/DEAH box helicase [Candidatus Poribacteria bacterium]|nr:NERD domain-containing protein/DEAD/DEAH box helicase [Candidatus Poribacteria bacterium]
MARMIPPFHSEDIKSSGEKQFFELLKHDPVTEDWVCLHSLGLARHVTRMYGEIDFVILVPNEGVFCLEVKSGRIARHEGVWKYTNRFGDTATSTVGPFRQAKEGMFSLLNSVRENYGLQHRFSNVLFGFGVVFPHIWFDRDDSEIESWQVYDRGTSRQPVSAYILQLSRYTRRSLNAQPWYDELRSRPSLSDIRELVDFLRGDFEQVIKPADVLIETEDHIVRLTKDQYRCLDQLQGNPRCLFEGGAGTGKTLLALEFARREATSGKRVLVICFNKLLGQWLSSVKGAMLPETVELGSFHQFLDQLIADSSVANDFQLAKQNEDQDHLFSELYPLYALDAIWEGGVEPFDTLIIDEGQDLIRSEYLDVFDGLLKGGLVGGSWAAFCDFHQAIYADVDEESMVRELELRTGRFTRFRLLTNCRNTRPIGEEVSAISGLDIPPFLPASVEGIPVNYRFYRDSIEQSKQVNEIIHQLLTEGVSYRDITILSPLRYEHTCLVSDDQISFKRMDLTRPATQRRPRKTIGFSTIHAFKGLESSVVVLVDIAHVTGNRNRALLYVGMSRARYSLSVLISESARDEYRNAIRKSLRRG